MDEPVELAFGQSFAEESAGGRSGYEVDVPVLVDAPQVAPSSEATSCGMDSLLRTRQLATLLHARYEHRRKGSECCRPHSGDSLDVGDNNADHAAFTLPNTEAFNDFYSRRIVAQ